MQKKYIVITTVNPKSEGVSSFESFKGWKIVLVGDQKSRHIDSSENLTFLSTADQKKLGYKFAHICPLNHYCRKNIGYLYAMEQGADIIYETDDDNLPNDDWSLYNFSCTNRCLSKERFINIYTCFTHEKVWPRGFPLDEIQKWQEHYLEEGEPAEIGIWQGLADIDPDVDAIYRLTVGKTIHFEDRPPLYLDRGCYCPSNSQNTFWQEKAFPYLYLPVTTSFRFTDILRGYIAQRLLWEEGLRLGFTKATVYQKRNSHDLMKDFREEMECYLNIKPLIALLDSLDLTSDPLTRMGTVYQALSENGFVKKEEELMLHAWVSDLRGILRRRERGV